MPKFSANIATLFTERPFLQRAAAAKQSGFAAIEMQFIHEMPLDDLVRAKEEAGLALAVFNLPAGDLTSGGPGLAAMPDRRRAFREAVDQAVGMAKRLAPVNVNILPGWPPAELDRDACWRTMVENVAVAADALGEVGVRVVVEALNIRDRPGAFLSTSDQVLALIDESN
ncbi:MAG: TIM barrel protein, partial [Alphaproteobacteria bacterium]|nr:TIM barrel protein [Alphaproteobacteria bacterium]